LDQTPASPFVFEFLGECNRLSCEVAGGVARAEGFAAPAMGAAEREGQGVALFRPHDTRLHAGPTAQGLPVRVLAVTGRGAVRIVECQAVSGERFSAELTEQLAAQFEPGQRVRLTAERVMIDFKADRPTRAAAVAPLHSAAL